MERGRLGTLVLAAALAAGCAGEDGDPGPAGPAGPEAAALHAIGPDGTDHGAVVYFERFYPLTVHGGLGTTNVAMFAVAEGAGTGPTYALMRALLTGTPFPCPRWFAEADCAGASLGFIATAATGLACAADGHAWRVSFSEAPVEATFQSAELPRWSGSDLVVECMNGSGTAVLIPAMEDLGTYATIAGPMHVEVR